MKDSSFPPRLCTSDDDDALRDLLKQAKGEAMAPSRATRAFATFEATRAANAGARETARNGSLVSSLTSKVLLVSIASIAIVSAFGFGWSVNHPSMAAPVPTLTASPEARPSPGQPAPAPPLAETATAPVPVAPAAPEPTPVRIEDLPPAPVPDKTASAPAADKPTRRPVANPEPAVSSFNEELALVEAARASLAKGDPSGCLGSLDRYDRRFSGGVFAHEVLVIRIEALVARGQRERARALGDAFLAKSPESPYASRIRSLLAPTP